MSENTGWTKGEWKTTEGAGVYALNRFGTNRFYCDIQAGHDGAGERTSEAELIANAHLIAAAPRMLEALKDLIAQMSGKPKSCGHEFHCVCPGINAQDVIAEAEGKDAD